MSFLSKQAGALTVIVGLSLCFGAHAEPEPLIDPSPAGKDWNQLLKAKPQKRKINSSKKRHGADGRRGVEVRFFVRASPDEALNMLWGVEEFQNIFPDIKKVDLKWKKASSLEVELVIDAVVTTFKYTLRRDLDRKARKVNWSRTEGDLEYVAGSWQVLPTKRKGVSEIVYTNFVGLGYFFPKSLYADAAMGKANGMAKRVRKVLASR